MSIDNVAQIYQGNLQTYIAVDIDQITEAYKLDNVRGLIINTLLTPDLDQETYLYDENIAPIFASRGNIEAKWDKLPWFKPDYLSDAMIVLLRHRKTLQKRIK
jgi:hypothetical protein